MRKHGLAAIDLLVIDVEGYEFEIISTINFAQTSIRFICYERVLLGDKLLPCENLLRQAGFRLIDFGQDTFGFRAPDSKLLRPWKQWVR
jgi:Methyltransferase FkbM domain